MKRVTKKAKMELLSKLARSSRSGETDWSLIADLYVRFMDEHPRSETTKDFISWLDDDMEATIFVDYFTKGQMLKFISDWVNEKDIQKFMNWLKDEREDLWEFLNDQEVDEDEYF